MGAGQSGGHEIGGSSMGYQVLRVYPNSPGSQAGLKAYFDFIVAIGSTRFNKEDGSLREILRASVDQKLKMVVYNTRSKQPREVEIVPTTSWGGSGLLGVSIKHSSFDKADERVWHVVEVDPGSPAHQASLKPGEDYVIGSDSILQESDDLYNLIEAHEGKALKLFVYNTTSDNCREVVCHPNSRWGGRGFLGCEFGHGLLHRIPYTEDDSAAGDNKVASQSKPIAQQQQPPLQANNYVRPQTIAQQHQLGQNSQLPIQPGHHLFQQALFNQSPNLPSLQQQLSRQPTAANQPTHNSLPPPSQMLIGAKPQPDSTPSFVAKPNQMPQTLQTFAQLANAQAKQDPLPYHYQQQSEQYQPQQQQNPQYQNLQGPPMQQQQQPQQQPQQHHQPPPQLQQQQQQTSPHQAYNSSQNDASSSKISALGAGPSQFPVASTWTSMTSSNQAQPSSQSSQEVGESALANSLQTGSTDSTQTPPMQPMIAHTFAQLAESQSHQPNATYQMVNQTQTPNQNFYQQQFYQHQQPPHYQP